MSVYFITCREAGAVKIGSSVDPKARCLALQRACPLSIVLEAVLPGGTDEEFTLHRLFADARIHHEWFRITTEIEAYIAEYPVPDDRNERRKAKLRRIQQVTNFWFLTRWEPELAAEIIEHRVADGDLRFPFRQRPLDIDLPTRRDRAA